jgi:cellulose synthase/poly-beta-1,6-N-acetylglucosamine synthase-like glycosyltransferase/protein-S-isoprenylcysteine O-methyltransferase Ste14
MPFFSSPSSRFCGPGSVLGRYLAGLARIGRAETRMSTGVGQGLSRRRESVVAVIYGVFCHGCFVAGVGTMMVMMFSGMSRSFGVLHAPWSYPANALLLAQFPLLHSMLLSRRGQEVLRRLAPHRLGGRLATTTYALIASVQVWLLFALWSPSGTVWWQASGVLFDALCVLYAVAWLLLLKSIIDAGFALQTGLLGWWAVARHRNPVYPPMPATGLFRLCRQPIYVSFALTLWTVPTITPDQLVVSSVLTAYCLVGPLFKEARFARLFGESFAHYQRSVPYWLPWPRRRAAVALPDNVLTGAKAIPASGQLQDALRAASPRLTPPPTPLASILIHGSIALLWVLLFARAFVLKGLLAWSVGVVYVSYDTALLAFVFWQTLGLAKIAAKPRSAGAAPVTLGVIVAAHNEAAGLPLTLAALFDQSEPPERIVIADDGSTDETAALLQRQFGFVEPALGALSSASSTHPTLHWLRLSHQGKPSALTRAMQLVDTEMILTVDADTLLEPNAIAAMRDAFASDPNLVAATGILTPVCGPGLSGRWFQWFQTYEYIRNFLSRYAWMQMDSLLLISGAFAAYRRHAVVEVGGFDPACLVEDYELIHRLRRYSVVNHRGWTASVVGASRALTDAPGSVGAFLRQRRRWFGGFLQTQYWYRDMVGNRAFSWLGLLMLPVKAADTLQPIYGLTAFALLLIYLVTGRFVLANPVIGVIGVKILVDFAFHLWSIHLYRRWAAPSARISFASGLLAALLEPFSFQILRHLGAAWGWGMFLTGARQWGTQHRRGLVVATSDMRQKNPGDTQDWNAKP